MIQQGPLKLLFSFLGPKDSFRLGCKGLKPGSEIRLVQGLHVVETGLIHPGERAWLWMGRG